MHVYQVELPETTISISVRLGSNQVDHYMNLYPSMEAVGKIVRSGRRYSPVIYLPGRTSHTLSPVNTLVEAVWESVQFLTQASDRRLP